MLKRVSRRSVRCEATQRQEKAAKKKVNSGSELTKLTRPERERTKWELQWTEKKNL